MPSLALYQPDIPQNAGAAIRLCACLDIDLHIIEPCGFVWDERKIKQAALDYRNMCTVKTYNSWEDFNDQVRSRMIVLTTKSEVPYTGFEFAESDILIAGRESAGLAPEVHDRADAALCIPMSPPARSLNVINAAAMVMGEAMKQTRWNI